MPSKTRTASTLFLACALALQLQTTDARAADPDGSQLVFPRFVSYSGTSSGIALFNPSSWDATVYLRLGGPQGTAIADPAVVRVPALGQVAATAEQLFPNVNPLDGSLGVASDTAGIVATYQTFDSAGTFMDGADGVSAGTELLFPIVPGSWEGVCEIDLLNSGSRTAAVELKLWSLSGEMLGRATVQVPAGGTIRNLAGGFFTGADLSGASHITATSRPVNVFSQAQPVSGTSIFAGYFGTVPPSGDVDIAAINATPLTQMFNAGVIPAFRTGPLYASVLSLASAEPASTNVTVTLVGNSGTILGTRTFNLPANGGARGPLETLVPGLGYSDQQGWILVQSSGRISATLIAGRNDTAALSVVPFQKSPGFGLVFPQVLQSAQHASEVSLVNPGSGACVADLFLVLPDGTTAASNQVTVPAGGRLMRTVAQIFPEISSQSGGILYVHAGQPLFASEAVWNAAGTVVTGFAAQTAAGGYAPAPLKSFAVTGRLTLNGVPAGGFRVALSGPAAKITTSAADGSYVFAGLPSGRYSMAVDQFGFQFLPAQVNFELGSRSRRQDFQGFTAFDGIVVQPSTVPAGGPDTQITIFGSGFNATSQAFIGPVRLQTAFVESSRINATLPAFLTAEPARLEVYVVTSDNASNRTATQPYPVVAFLDKPVLSGLTVPGYIVEGSPGATITLRGAGFLKGAKVKVNGQSDGVQLTFIDDGHMLAYLPPSYFARGGIFPVSVENPYPSNVESNVQLLTVYYPAPAVQTVIPSAAPVRLNPGAGPLDIEVLGYGFRRGAVVLFNGTPLNTTYCESSAYCLSVHLYAKVPAAALRESGFAEIVVRNPDPSMAASEAAFLRLEGLQPTITSAVPGSATVLNMAGQFNIPVVVNGTNFGPQTLIRIYKAGTDPLPAFTSSNVEVLGSNQLVGSLRIDFAAAVGEWKVEVANPQPGGGVSQPFSFFITEGTFVANPFLISLAPDAVAAGGPAFTLTINGTNFRGGAVVELYTTRLPATIVSDRQIRAEVPAALIQNAGRVPVSVISPDNGGSSNRLYLDIR